MNKLFLIAILLILALGLAACGSANGPLLDNVTADAGSLDLANGYNQDEPINIAYHIGKPAQVSVVLSGPQQQGYALRTNEERTVGNYNLVINGTIDQVENGLAQTRLLPDGNYTYTVKAVATDETSQVIGHFQVKGNPTQAKIPKVEALAANPSTISPNFDARDDSALLGWRTTEPATVTVSITGGNNFSKILKTIKNQPAQEDKTTFDGLDQRGEPLADGIYTYTVQAADQWGNVTRQASTLEIKGGGRPSALIQQARIGPTEIIRGNLITVTVRVRNVGKVPIRSQGPDSGYVYSTRDVFSSIEGGKYNDAAGFWRVGVDFESNSGGGASRYPFRWGFGRELQPGEEAEVVGVIRVERTEEKLKFYVGLIQEQIRLPQDHIQVTEVKIGY